MLTPAGRVVFLAGVHVVARVVGWSTASLAACQVVDGAPSGGAAARWASTPAAWQSPHSWSVVRTKCSTGPHSAHTFRAASAFSTAASCLSVAVRFGLALASTYSHANR